MTRLGGVLSGKGFSSSMDLLQGNARAKETERRFSALIDGVSAGMDAKPADTIGTGSDMASRLDTRLPGDFISSMAASGSAQTDALPVGAASQAGQKGRIDRTSALYEKALELESYVVKIMLSSMRNTVQKSGFAGNDSFASKMYEDMMYDELSRSMTKNAGFGLADQVYLQLKDSLQA